jgi:hypothetical protein
VSVSFRRITQNWFPLELARTARDLRAAGQVEVQAVRDRLRIRDRHKAQAGGRGLVGPGDDLALTRAQDLPAGCLRPEPGRPGQVASVSDDVMEPDRHAVRMCGRRTAAVIDQTHAAVSATRSLTMRWLRRVSGIVWIFSWYTIYLEIFRWHHMTKTLRFNPPPPLPGTDIEPRPGAPLIAVCLGSVTAPLVFLTATMIERIRARPGNTPPRRLASKS